MSAAPPDTRDFVDRLVIKALGAAELPMPRLPSLFEAPPTFSETGADLVEADGETSAQQPPVTGSPVRVARSPLATGSPRPHVPDSTVGRTQPDEQDLAVRDAAGRVSGQPATRPRADEPATDHGSRTATAAPQVRAGLTHRDTVVPDTRQPNAKPPSPVVARDGRMLAPSASVRNVAEHLRSEEHRISGPSADDRSQAVLVPRASGIAPSPGGALTAQPGPTPARAPDANDGRASPDVAVNVSIGRIEVKATRTDAPERKRGQPRGPQPMALDEYLGQRGAR